MQKTKIVLPLLLVFLLIAAITATVVLIRTDRLRLSRAANTTYYISTTGNDSNSGTRESQAWRSLGRITSASLGPGDRVLLQKGGSWDGEVTIDESGQSGNPITLGAYGSGNKPLIRNGGININGDWIIVDGVAVTGVSNAGIDIGGSAERNVIRNVEVSNSGAGVIVNGQYNLIEHSYFHDLVMVRNTQGGDDDYGATAVWIFANNNEVAYNRMERCEAPSYDYGADGGAVETYRAVSNLKIHHNYTENNNSFMEIGFNNSSQMARDIEIHHNVMVSNGGIMAVHLSGTFGGQISNIRLHNNTVVERDGGRIFWFGGRAPSSSEFQFRNNIVYTRGVSQFSNYSFSGHSNNVFYAEDRTSFSGLSMDSVDKWANPMFVNLGGADYHLQLGSPAIDAGANLGYTKDFEDKSITSAPDIGAYEYGATGSPTATPTNPPTIPPTQPGTQTPTPTGPANTNLRVKFQGV